MNDNKNLTPMMKQYFSVKEKHKDYLLFYRMGDFYEMFFDDAIKASAALDIALTKRGKESGKDVPMCGVPVAAHDVYLQRLIRKGFKVAICEQLEDPAEAKKRGASSCVKRDVIRIITPGTITEDSILDARKNNYLLVIAEAPMELGLAWVDVSTGEFATQAIPASFLGAAFSRLDASEIIVSDKTLENIALKDDLAEVKDRLTVLSNLKFSTENARKRLENTFEVKTLDAFGNFSKAEITAAGVLIDYIELTQKGQIPRLQKPKQVLDGDVMEIDASSRRSLEIFSSLSGERGTSLLSIMDKTVTGPGARLLAQQLASPLTDEDTINQRLDIVDFFITNPVIRDKLRSLLQASPDMERSLSRLSLKRGGPRDLSAIRDTLAKIPSLSTLFYKDGIILPKPLEKNLQMIGNHSHLVDLLERALGKDLPLFIRDGGFIATGYNSELDELRTLRDESRRLIVALQSKYAQEVDVSSLKICHNNVLGYYVEVNAKYAQSLLESEAKGKTVFIHRQTLANTARFTTVELSSLEEKIRGAAEKAIALEIAIFENLTTEVLTYAEDIIRAGKVFAILDVRAALAILAYEQNYVRPIVDNSLAFIIKKGRHPVVEVALQEAHDTAFVPNDCEMDQDKSRLWLITGPNMAGKSTFLRQNALIAIMAQMGSFVPAESAKIGIVDKIFSRVGASDDLARGRSTFMVEMVETAAILNRSTEKSFVILDEIGRGTATFDGLAIAWAVAEALHEKNQCRALFATHYHELTILAERLSRLSLHTMKTKEWKDNVVFLHEVAEGCADRSYGIHVAKLAGLPIQVVERAKQVLLELENKNNQIENLAKDLPLFAVFENQMKLNNDEKKPSPLVQTVKKINPDLLSPREALDLVYQLVNMSKDET